MPQSPKVFISYRRNDEPVVTQLLHRELEKAFGRGKVFLDLRQIKAGATFPDEIEKAIDGASLVVVVIGNEWLGVQEDQAVPSRISNPDDWVRKEVSKSLQGEKTLLPVLVRGAKLPSADELPADLQAIRQFHCFTLAGADVHQEARQFREEAKRRYREVHTHQARDWKITASIVGLSLFFAGWAAGLLTSQAFNSDASGLIPAIPIWIAGIVLAVRFWRKGV